MRNKVTLLLAVFLLAVALTSRAADNIEKNNCDEIYRQVQLFADSLAIIQSQYVEQPKPKSLIYGSLKGMLASLDPYSQFMDPETYNELKVDTQGKFGGIGIEITIKDGQLIIITPIEDTPAWRAGLRPGDIIAEINTEPTRDLELTEAVKKMRGKPGEEIKLSILREPFKKMLEVKITRAIIKIKDVKEAKILENGIAYVRLIEFSENTPANLNSALERLSKSKMKALILDLRNNPGGLLESAIDVTSKFLPNAKLVVYTKGRKAEDTNEYS